MRRSAIALLGLVLLRWTTGAYAIEPKETSLSGKARLLSMGLDRATVLDLLGTATWAVLPTDDGPWALPDPSWSLELYWRNSGCFLPVVVSFNATGRVNGWNQGRVCVSTPTAGEPGEKYSCSRTDREELCTKNED